MFMVIVVLSNILIGQISFQYSTAQMEATIQNDIDRAKLLTGLDRSILTCVSHSFYFPIHTLTHFMPLVSFSITRKHQKTLTLERQQSSRGIM